MQPFALADVRLLPGPFFKAQEANRALLLRYDADRLLHTFRINAGLIVFREAVWRLGKA
ncbi:MAG: beta-L-arabinofuranosidase domain-containing protein [Bryobacteraceae bacterium]